MALRQLLIGRQIAELRTELNELTEKAAEISTRRAAWTEREARAETALEEMNDETTAEERAAFDAEAAEIDAEETEIRAAEEANASRTGEIQEKIAELEGELAELNNRGTAAPERPAPSANKNEGGNNNMPEIRDAERMELREIVKNDEVKNYLAEFRARFANKRAVSNAVYTIPTLMLPLVRNATDRYSKLLKHVNRRSLKGDGQLNVIADAPEAVWTETTGKINELTAGFYQFSTYGSKLAGYIPVPNPYLDDSDENLAAIIVDQLGQANGYASDKAILYGTGTKMPIGIVTRLAATTSPAWWQSRMPTFTDLHTSHVGKLSAASVTGLPMFQEMAGILGKAKGKYAPGSGSRFWAMNDTTWLKLQIALMGINADGALVTAAQAQMPFLGGAVEIVDFVPDNNIIGGDGAQYLWVDRAGVEIDFSEHVQFLDDNTVFRVRSRADGLPISGEGFAAFSLSTSNVTTSVTFAPDTANTPPSGT